MSPQQCLWLLTDAPEAFYGGAAGGGKTYALLMAALQYVDVPKYAALILRRTMPQLTQPGQLIPVSKEWFLSEDVPTVERPAWNEQRHDWTFPSGAVLRFGHVEHEDSKFNYQGGGYHFTGFDELTQFSETQYKYIAFSRRRRDMTFARQGIPTRVRSAANPGGIGHAWVKPRFVDEKTRRPGAVFIPAKVNDNRGLDIAEYVETLSELDDTLRAQLLDGDWGAFEGAAFTITDDHLIDAFPLDDSLERFEAADYGLNGAPWALCPVDFEGNVVFWDMLYEKNLLPSDLAALVVAKRKAGWGLEHDAFMDPSVWHRTGARNKWGAPAMLADEFTDNGVHIIPANNDPRAGLIRLRELLTLDPAHPFPDWHPRRGELGAPRVFFHRTQVAALVSELQSAPLQPLDKRDGGEIIDPTWESRHGHACALARYAVMTRPAPTPAPELEFDDPRAALLHKIVNRSTVPSYQRV